MQPMRSIYLMNHLSEQIESSVLFGGWSLVTDVWAEEKSTIQQYINKLIVYNA